MLIPNQSIVYGDYFAFIILEDSHITFKVTRGIEELYQNKMSDDHFKVCTALQIAIEEMRSVIGQSKYGVFLTFPENVEVHLAEYIYSSLVMECSHLRIDIQDVGHFNALSWLNKMGFIADLSIDCKEIHMEHAILHLPNNAHNVGVSKISTNIFEIKGKVLQFSCKGRIDSLDLANVKFWEARDGKVQSIINGEKLFCLQGAYVTGFNFQLLNHCPNLEAIMIHEFKNPIIEPENFNLLLNLKYLYIVHTEKLLQVVLDKAPNLEYVYLQGNYKDPTIVDRVLALPRLKDCLLSVSKSAKINAEVELKIKTTRPDVTINQSKWVFPTNNLKLL